MATINIPASALAFVKRGDSSSWSYAGAMQGAYSGGYPRVGAMQFASVHQIDWPEQVISEIRLTAAFSAAGGNYAKTLGLYRATRSGIGGTGNGIIGQYLGSTGTNGAAYNATRTMYFNANSQPELFANLVAWLQSMSVDTLALYMGDGSPSGSYSANYLQINAATLSIDYEPVGSKGTLDKTEAIAGTDTITLTVEPIEADGEVTHSVLWRLGSYSAGGEISAPEVLGFALEVPEVWCNDIADSTSGTAECILTTYVDGVEKSQRTLTFTVLVPESAVPSFSATIAPYDTTDGYYQYIGGAQIDLYNIFTALSAPIVQYAVSGSEGVKISGTDAGFIIPDFQLSGEHSYTITITDSRGRTASKTVSCHVTELYAPTISAFAVKRYSAAVNDAGETVYTDDPAGGHVRISLVAGADPAGGNNTATAWIVYGEVGGDATSRANLTWPAGQSQIEYADERALISEAIPIDAAYEFTLFVTDEHSGVTAYARVEKGWTAVHVSGNGYGVGVGGYVMDGTPENPIFRSYYPAQFVAGIEGVTNYTTEKTPTGGRWLDGRPVYRSMFELGAIAAGGSQSFKLDLGGDNLLTGTRAFSGEWRNSALWTADGEYNGLTVRTYAGVWDGIAQAVYLEPGIYTFSGWVKGANGASVNAYGTHDGSAVFAPTGVVLGAASEEFTRLRYTFEVTAAGYVRPRFENITDGGQLWVCGLKLEKGSTVTPWIPAEADGDTLETPTLMGGVVSLRGMAQLDYWGGMWVQIPYSNEDTNWEMSLFVTEANSNPVNIGVINNKYAQVIGGYALIEYTLKE